MQSISIGFLKDWVRKLIDFQKNFKGFGKEFDRFQRNFKGFGKGFD